MPVDWEVGRWKGVPRDERACALCGHARGDVQHLVSGCPKVGPTASNGPEKEWWEFLVHGRLGANAEWRAAARHVERAWRMTCDERRRVRAVASAGEVAARQDRRDRRSTGEVGAAVVVQRGPEVGEAVSALSVSKSEQGMQSEEARQREAEQTAARMRGATSSRRLDGPQLVPGQGWALKRGVVRPRGTGREA